MKRMFVVVVLEELFHKASYNCKIVFSLVTCFVEVLSCKDVPELQSPFFNWHFVSQNWFHFYSGVLIKLQVVQALTSFLSPSVDIDLGLSRGSPNARLQTKDEQTPGRKQIRELQWGLKNRTWKTERHPNFQYFEVLIQDGSIFKWLV